MEDDGEDAGSLGDEEAYCCEGGEGVAGEFVYHLCIISRTMVS